MTDYCSLIADAVDGLSQNTAKARRTVYERARVAQVAQLRALDPPIPEKVIIKERWALENATLEHQVLHKNMLIRATLSRRTKALTQ
jgi:hypothetical protein